MAEWHACRYRQGGALSREYELYERRAGRNCNFSDLMNHSMCQGKIYVFGLGLAKEPVDLFSYQRSLFFLMGLGRISAKCF